MHMNMHGCVDARMPCTACTRNTHAVTGSKGIQAVPELPSKLNVCPQPRPTCSGGERTRSYCARRGTRRRAGTRASARGTGKRLLSGWLKPGGHTAQRNITFMPASACCASMLEAYQLRLYPCPLLPCTSLAHRLGLGAADGEVLGVVAAGGVLADVRIGAGAPVVAGAGWVCGVKGWVGGAQHEGWSERQTRAFSASSAVALHTQSLRALTCGGSASACTCAS